MRKARYMIAVLWNNTANNIHKKARDLLSLSICISAHEPMTIAILCLGKFIA